MKEHFYSLSKDQQDEIRSTFDVINLFAVALVYVGGIITAIMAGVKCHGHLVPALFELAVMLYIYIVPFDIIRIIVFLYAKFIYAYYHVDDDKILKLRYHYDSNDYITYYTRYIDLNAKTAYFKYFIKEPFNVGAVVGEPSALKTIFGDALVGFTDFNFKLKLNRKTKTLISRYLSLENISCYLEQPKE